MLLNKLRKKAHDFNKLSSPISPRTSFIIPWKLSRRLIVQLFFHPFHPSVTTASLYRFFNNRKARLKLLTKEHELYRREQDRVSLNEEKRRVEGAEAEETERERERKKKQISSIDRTSVSSWCLRTGAAASRRRRENHPRCLALRHPFNPAINLGGKIKLRLDSDMPWPTESSSSFLTFFQLSRFFLFSMLFFRPFRELYKIIVDYSSFSVSSYFYIALWKSLSPINQRRCLLE